MGDDEINHGYFEMRATEDDAVCSDSECPCPETPIPRGGGYLYISEDLVRFRRGYPRIADAVGVRSVHVGMGVDAVLVCEVGARRRGLDLATAAADARRYWETARAPLRATPPAAASPFPAAPSLLASSPRKKSWWKVWR